MSREHRMHPYNRAISIEQLFPKMDNSLNIVRGRFLPSVALRSDCSDGVCQVVANSTPEGKR